MANNRLFMGHCKTKKYIMLCKGFGAGWCGINSVEKINLFLENDDFIPESDVGADTDLFLFTEYSMVAEEIFNSDKWELLQVYD